MLKKSSVLITLVLLVKISDARRGPHHPKGPMVKRETRKQEFNEHLSHGEDEDHMEQDLTGMHVHHKSVAEMSDEEKSFYYFKIHDTDNNDFLDGLEMIKAAVHRHGNIELQDELTHVTSVVDEFLDFADENKDGLLNYAEYVQAMNSSQEDKESKPPLSSADLHNEDVS